MADGAKYRVLLVVSMAALIAGCQGEGSPFGQRQASGLTGPSAETTAAAPATTRSVKLVDRDVEAPDVFSVTDMALWDGRPSLGGVWVASPDAVDPERVILRNPANGKFVIGALFRRERDNPGPALQISSDAAAALGLLAGQPGKIGVTALRREEAPLAAPDASRPILDAAETVATETLDPAPTVAPADGTASVAAAAEDKKPRGLGLFKKRQPKSDGPVAPVVSSETLGTETATAAPSSTVSPSPAPAAPPKGGLIQIGIFSVEANAKRAVDTLSKAGIAATIRQETAQGKAFWSVTATGGAESLVKIKAAGFADAYMLKRG
ncbi:Sporulation-like domain containing protein [Paracoccaceae bacterium]